MHVHVCEVDSGHRLREFAIWKSGVILQPRARAQLNVSNSMFAAMS